MSHCASCGNSTTTGQGRAEVTIDGVTFAAQMPSEEVCHSCGKDGFSPLALLVFTLEVANTLITRTNLRSGAVLAFCRKATGMTRERCAEALGVTMRELETAEASAMRATDPACGRLWEGMKREVDRVICAQSGVMKRAHDFYPDVTLSRKQDVA